jgi:predicted dehydrogenase
MTIKIAFIGTGYISNIHAQAAEKLPDVTLEAVVDLYPKNVPAFAEKFGITRHYTHIENLLDAGGVDAVVIGTPNYVHALQTIAALDAGVHVLVEKPMAINGEEADAMVEAAERSPAILLVGHCWRFDAEVRWLKKRVERGILGQIVRTRGYGIHTHWGPAGWFTEKRYAGGGALADMGIHAIDTARFLIGDPEPESVYARIGTYYKEMDVDDTGMIIINWKNGISSYVESGWWQPHMDGPEAATQLYGTTGFGQLFPTYLELPNVELEKIERVDAGFEEREPHCLQSMYDAQMTYFVTCIRGDCQPTPGPGEGRTNVRIVDAAYESARSGKVVAL